MGINRYNFACLGIPGLLAPLAYLDFKGTETPELYHIAGNKSSFHFINEQIHNIPYFRTACTGFVINGIDNISFGEFAHCRLSPLSRAVTLRKLSRQVFQLVIEPL